MGIYTRDNINYGGMLANAMAQRANLTQREYENYMKQPTAWANALKQSGQDIGNAMFKIAGNYYDQDKIAQAQAFQASEAEKRAVEAMERQKEQQKFQEAQNELNRKNNLAIAEFNKETAIDEKHASNIMHYNNAVAAKEFAEQALKDVKPGTTEYFQAQKALAEANNRIEYYSELLPAKLRPQRLSNVVVGEDAEKALMSEDWKATPATEATKPAYQIKDDTNELTALLEKPVLTDAEYARAVKLANGDNALLQKIKNKGPTKEARDAAFQTNKAVLETELATAKAKGPATYRKFKKDNEARLKKYKVTY